VVHVEVNTATARATVTFAPEKTNVEELIRALETGGFEVLGSHKFIE
jgi:copper chaperone CopZ